MNLHAVDHFWKRRILDQIAKPEPSRIVEMVREEVKQPRIERQYYEPKRLNDVCYEE